MVPLQTMRIVYFALYQSIFQYGLLVWGGLGVSILRQLQTNQNNIVRICLNKHTLVGLTNKNYSDLGVLPIKSLYKKIAIIFIFNRFIKGKYNKSLVNKREMVFDIPVEYTKKSFGQSFFDYLGPTYFNSMHLQYKKNTHIFQSNAKRIIYK